MLQLMKKKFLDLHLLWAGAVLAFIILIFFSSLLLSDKFFLADGLIPEYFHIDWWSTYIFSGFPMITDPIWHIFYPVKYLIYKLLKLDFNYYILSGYFFMAYFTYAYVYFLNKNIVSALVSGLLFCFSGFAIFEIGHASVFIHTICWLPLVLLSFENLKINYSATWSLIGILGVVMSIAGGFPQLSITMAAVFFTYSLLLVLQSDNKLKKLILYYGILFSGYLISLPILVPTLLQSYSTSRDAQLWVVFASFFVEIKQLLLFVFPYLMGGYYSFYPGTPPFGDWDTVGNHGYVGFLTLILAGISIYKVPSFLKYKNWYWTFLCFMSVLLALGPQTGFFYEFLFKVPIINKLRAPERYLFIFAFGMSVLAGLAIDTIQKGLIKSLREKRVIILTVLIATMALLVTTFHIYPAIQSLYASKMHAELPSLLFNCAFYIPLIWIVFSLSAFIYWLRKTDSLFRLLLTVTILLAEVFFTAYFSYWHPQFAFWSKSEIHNPPSYVKQLKTELDSTHQRYLTMQMNAGLGKYFTGNLPLYYKLPSAGGYTSLAVYDYLNFLLITDYGIYMGAPDQFENNQAINITGIKYFLTEETPDSHIWFKNSKKFILKNKIDNLLVYQNLNALPRGWFVSKVSKMDRFAMLPVIHSGKFSDGANFDPAKIALVEKNSSLDLYDFQEDKTSLVKIKKLEGGKIIVNTESKTNQFLVLSDIYYPGWYAYLDGKKADIYRADYIYRGIIVPKGHHKIKFIFKPYYVLVSIGVSIFCVLSILILMLYRRFKR
ncbi:MAG TPA: YfhO family protein [Gammaproteobacteria bacterium]|nr:YfhO family protein [Gammaproteobacteria bacterium]